MLSQRRHNCFVNLGLYCFGTSTLAQAVSQLGAVVDRSFQEIDQTTRQRFLTDPQATVSEWYGKGGREELLDRLPKNGLLCDGWVPLLAFLRTDQLRELQETALIRPYNVEIQFLATTQVVEGTVRSELHHWVRHDLERKSGLSEEQRGQLETHLRQRAEHHEACLHDHKTSGLDIKQLALEDQSGWSGRLSSLSARFSQEQWQTALDRVDKQNANPKPPLQAILLTMRIDEYSIAKVAEMFDVIEQDATCRYMVVVAIDNGQQGDLSDEFVTSISSRPRIEQCIQI